VLRGRRADASGHIDFNFFADAVAVGLFVAPIQIRDDPFKVNIVVARIAILRSIENGQLLFYTVENFLFDLIALLVPGCLQIN